MQAKMRVAAIAGAIVLMIVPDMLAAQAGHMHRATRRRTAVVVHSATKAQDQQAAEAQQPAAEPEPAPAAAPAAAPAGALAVGTVLTALPDGCPATTVGDQQYYTCGGNWYRAAYQEGNVVYVTTDPPQ